MLGKRADSGTRRSLVGWDCVVGEGREGPIRAAAVDCSSFGVPRTAAAQERRVVRLARRTASWSVWKVCPIQEF